MTSMRKAVVWAAAAAVVGLMGGCNGAVPPGDTFLSGSSASTSPGPADSTSPVAVNPAGTLSPKEICGGALGAAGLLDWAPGTVAQFRAYQYGGPTATVPLSDAFPNISGNTGGAWCGTKGGPDATHWWAVVVGHEAASVITINGPGEGVEHGSVAAPPRVP